MLSSGLAPLAFRSRERALTWSGATGYGDPPWHWADWQDGGWGTATTTNATLDNHSCNTTQITSITCTPKPATYHWKLVSKDACNAVRGAIAPWTATTAPFACNSTYVGGHIWTYFSGGGFVPPPNPSVASNYGWVGRYCDVAGCTSVNGGTGTIADVCLSTANNMIWQCVNQ